MITLAIVLGIILIFVIYGILLEAKRIDDKMAVLKEFALKHNVKQETKEETKEDKVITNQFKGYF